MNRERTPEERLFADALALPPAERSAFLVKACGANVDLISHLVGLIAAHEGPETLLRSSHLRQGFGGQAAPPHVLRHEEKPGDAIGRYKLLQKIGEGGCGVVWMAEQEEPVRRRVALKVIKLGMDTKAVVARFEAERQALAMMDHPCIAKVHDAGSTDTGRPYFVMELVRGIPITKYCDENHLTPKDRLELFIKVCQAIQHAHQKGVIHRDIKPSNILVTVNDGQPTPKVIDFGIAKATQGKLTDATVFTAFEQFIGTPVYMSPEQAEMSSLDIDTRSDVYSLGVLLYELLTGRPPFDPKTFAQAGVDQIRKQIREVEPPRPSARLSTMGDEERTTLARQRGTLPAQLSVMLRGDLDWIVMRCLEKDRTHRYDTANGLAMDIQRYLHDEPVIARPPSTAYLVQKLIRRHRVGVAAAIIIVGVVVIGSFVTARQATRALRAERVQGELLKAAHVAEAKAAVSRRAAEEEQQRSARIRWARETVLPEINRLIKRDEISAAFELARQVEADIPGDPALIALWPQISATVTIESVPSDAEVRIKPYRKPDSDWRQLGKTPLKDIRLPRDLLRWDLKKAGFAPLERAAGPTLTNFGGVATSFRFVLEEEHSSQPGMILVRGARTNQRATRLPEVRLQDYWMDRYEVSNRQFKDFVDRGGYSTEAFWKHTFISGERVLRWNQAMDVFRDSTGRPGPATWKDGTYAEGEADHPVTGVSWFEAAAYAEFAGKRLPSVFHWRHAANADLGAWILPLSNFSGLRVAAVGQNHGVSWLGMYDMAGNAKEWCWNEAGENQRFLLGGGWREPEYMFFDGDAQAPFDRSAMNGFRCIRLRDPALAIAEIDAPRSRSFPDYTKEKPVSDEKFEIFKRMYVYDRTNLEPVVEAVKSSDKPWRAEKASFNAAYNNERMSAFVFLPKNVSPPYQAILFFPGSSVWTAQSGETLHYEPQVTKLVEGGRAVIYPIYKGTYERAPRLSWGGVEGRDWRIQISKDLGRTIDYLETRADLRMDKLGYVGYSWGAGLAPILTAIETRIKVNVLAIGGAYFWKDFPEADPFHFAPRVTVPTLMLNGRYDFTFPLATSQRPLFDWLGTPAEHKRHVIYDTGHMVPPNQSMGEIFAWLDRYLGPAK